MATITRHKGGWRVFVYSHGRRATKVFSKKTDAQRWAAMKKLEMDAEVGKGCVPVPLRKAIERYIDEVSPSKKGERFEVIRLRRLLKSWLADKKTDAITPADITAWRDERLKQVKPSSVRREMTTLSCVFNACMDWGYATSNPVKAVKRPPEAQPRDRRISDDEIARILEALEYRDGKPIVTSKQLVGALFLLALETAMRLGELCSISAENVNLDGRYIVLEDTKNGTRRHVPLSSRAVELVRAVLAADRRVASGTATTIFRRAVKLAGIDNLRFHDTRHEALTRLARKLDVLDLARMVGHKDPRSLMIYYNATATEIANRLD